MKLINRVFFVFIFISINSLAQTGNTVHFIGTDNNWFNTNNWDSGRLPDANTDIVLTAGQNIMIDPTMAPSPNDALIVINNIDLFDATLSLFPDSKFQYNKMILIEDALLDTQSSEIIGDSLEINRNGTNPGGFGVKFNPTTNDTRSIKITANTSKIQMFLGGMLPANTGNVGMGHYATLLADDVELNGELIIDTKYGFQPQIGDVFQIVTARNTLMGQFSNANEGGIVTTVNGVDLRISYRGGDGNDVVLTAVSQSVRYIGSDANWFEPSNWDSGVVPDANTNIILTSGQSILIDPTLSPTGNPVIINDLLLESATLTTLPNTQFQYNNLYINEDALFDTQSSEIIGVDMQINRNGTNPGGFGVRLNPTTNDNRSIKITGSSARVALFLGGTTPASPGNVGTGHYATLLADDIELNGELVIDTKYGFEPQVGDVFEIIKARASLIGRFNNVNEGDVIASFNGVHLVLSYESNTDGSKSVILTATEDLSVFIGPGTDWNNPDNWSTGAVPDDEDSVLIATGQSTIINKLGAVAAPYRIAKIQGQSGSSLEIHQSTIEVSGPINGDIVSTLLLVESSMTNTGINTNASATSYKKLPPIRRPWGGTKLNPSQMLVNGKAEMSETNLTFVLGGTQAANGNNTGVGFYGNIMAHDITLGSSLHVETKYSFEPQVGDVFKIITTNTFSGQFSGLEEGDLVTSFKNVSLFISYQGGDGNDVVLTAVESNDLIFKNSFEQ